MMKKCLLIVSGILITCMTHSQVIKIQGGYSMTRLKWTFKSSTKDYYPDIYTGYAAGAGLNFGKNKYFNFSANVGLVKKGGENTVYYTNDLGITTNTFKIKATLDYLTVNGTINLILPLKSRFKPYISIGPRFDYLVNHSDEFNEGIDSGFMISYSYGLITGIGIKYEYKKLLFGIETDYYLNFNKIADWPASSTNLGGSITNNTITNNLIIGYKLR